MNGHHVVGRSCINEFVEAEWNDDIVKLERLERVDHAEIQRTPGSKMTSTLT